jgi:hypothetical protein
MKYLFCINGQFGTGTAVAVVDELVVVDGIVVVDGLVVVVVFGSFSTSRERITSFPQLVLAFAKI